MTFVVGVDGGGTKHRAVIVDEEGREVGRGQSPGAVVTADDPERAASAVRTAVLGAATNSRVQLPAAIMWVGLAGAGRPLVRKAVMPLLDDGSLATEVHVGTDVEAAFFDAFGNGPGILLIAGTGSVLMARDPSGAVANVGGWGRHLGDEGSGYAIGLKALRYVVRAEDGRMPPTALRVRVLRSCGLDAVDDLVSWVRRASKAQVAALAPRVIDAADDGDSAAMEIVADSIRDLAEHVRAGVERTGPWEEPAPLILWGGLLGEGGPLRSRAVEGLLDVNAQLSSHTIDPPIGAARLALAQLS